MTANTAGRMSFLHCSDLFVEKAGDALVDHAVA